MTQHHTADLAQMQLAAKLNAETVRELLREIERLRALLDAAGI